MSDEITRSQFIDAYCEASGIPWAELRNSRTVLPCSCGDSGCEGWAMMSQEPHLIEWHMQFYA